MFDPLKSLEKHLGEFDFNSRVPLYNDSSDYTTNAPSYYDDLARKNKLIKHLALRIWDYDEELKKRFEAWDKNLEEFDDEVLRLLKEWMDNGRFDEIINEVIFEDLNNKINSSALNVAYPPFGLTRVERNGTPDKPVGQTIQEAIDYQYENGGGIVFIPSGKYYIETTLTVHSGVHLEGVGFIESYDGNTDIRPTQLIKMGNILGIDLGVVSSVSNLILDGYECNMNDGIRLNGNSARCENVTVSEMGGNGFVVGNKDVKRNMNAWTLINCKAIRNHGNGFVVDTLNTGAGPDANGGMALKCNAWNNEQNGWYINESAVNSFIACYSESNKQNGYVLGPASKRNTLLNVHAEQNFNEQFLFEQGSANNFVITSSEAIPVDNGANAVIQNTGGTGQHIKMNRSLSLGKMGYGHNIRNGFHSVSNFPGFTLTNTNAPEGQQTWSISANGSNLDLRKNNDDGSGPEIITRVRRNETGILSTEFRKPLDIGDTLRFKNYKSVYEQPISNNPLRVVEVFNVEGISLGYIPIHQPVEE